MQTHHEHHTTVVFCTPCQHPLNISVKLKKKLAGTGGRKLSYRRHFNRPISPGLFRVAKLVHPSSQDSISQPTPVSLHFAVSLQRHPFSVPRSKWIRPSSEIRSTLTSLSTKISTGKFVCDPTRSLQLRGSARGDWNPMSVFPWSAHRYG